MTTTEEAGNKQTLRRFDAAVNTRDLDLISTTIDELFRRPGRADVGRRRRPFTDETARRGPGLAIRSGRTR